MGITLEKIKQRLQGVLETAGDVFTAPGDVSRQSPEKMAVRVRYGGWASDGSDMATGFPIAGRHTYSVVVEARWQYHSVDDLRALVRRIQCALLMLDLQAVEFADDDDIIAAEMTFTELASGGYSPNWIREAISNDRD